MYYLFRKGYGLIARPFDFQNQKDLEIIQGFIDNCEPVIIVNTLEDLQEYDNVDFENVTEE